jgi:hypothetical protein
MTQVGIHKLKYIADKWNVWIDGYSIPFPDLKEAQSYLDYINRWASQGEVISYDPIHETLIWVNRDKTSINANPAKGRVAPSPHKVRRNKDTKHAENVKNHIMAKKLITSPDPYDFRNTKGL